MSDIIAILAFVVSAVGFYFQFLRLRGARLCHLNAGTGQRAILMRYNELPQNIRDDFPRYADKHDGYLFVRLAFANTGDRSGFCDIKQVVVSINDNSDLADEDRIAAAYYSYTVVGPHDVKTHALLLRNLPPSAHSQQLQVNLSVDYAWVDPRRGLVERKQNVESVMTIHVEYPSCDDHRLPLLSTSSTPLHAATSAEFALTETGNNKVSSGR